MYPLQCAYEPELPLHPTWIWEGLSLECGRAMAAPHALCGAVGGTRAGWANGRVGPLAFSLEEKCDATCDCADCVDEPSDCVYPNKPANFCDGSTQTAVCTCNNGVEVPYEWLCDGAHDCGMDEDETTGCTELYPNPLSLWGSTLSLSSATAVCYRRWESEVVPDCGSGLNAAGGASGIDSASCDATCKVSIFATMHHARL